MGDKTGIEWSEATWNPIVGCSIISPACRNCYAMEQAGRIERMTPGTHYRGTTETVNDRVVWTGLIREAPAHIFTLPLRWARPRRIFVNSMSDLFHGGVEVGLISQIYATMIVAHHYRGHTLQWLTKRPERAAELLNDAAFWNEVARDIDDVLSSMTFGMRDPKSSADRAAALRAKIGKIDASNPPPGIWAGVTAEDQTRADERIPFLLSTPAAAWFVSCEPLLGEINLSTINFWSPCNIPEFGGEGHELLPALRPALRKGRGPGIDLVIAGGESGRRARASHPDWFRSLRDQCATAGIAFDFKQWGEWAPSSLGREIAVASNEERVWRDGEWSGTMSAVGTSAPDTMNRVGKTRAGRHLDGKEHNGSEIFKGTGK